MAWKLVLAALLSLAAILACPGVAAAGDDEDGIRRAVLDYANSAYLVRPDLIDRSVHPALQKIGYTKRGDDADYREHWMNFYELKALVADWNVDSQRFDPATARREVSILDRLDQTAVARLDAEWGIDYFHLARHDGRWMIMNVIWQSYPPESEPAAASAAPEGEAPPGGRR